MSQALTWNQVLDDRSIGNQSDIWINEEEVASTPKLPNIRPLVLDNKFKDSDVKSMGDLDSSLLGKFNLLEPKKVTDIARFNQMMSLLSTYVLIRD